MGELLLDKDDFMKMKYVYFNSDFFEKGELRNRFYEFKKFSMVEIEDEYKRVVHLKSLEKKLFTLTFYTPQKEIVYEFNNSHEAYEKVFEVEKLLDVTFNKYELAMLFDRLNNRRYNGGHYLKCDSNNVFMGITKKLIA